MTMRLSLHIVMAFLLGFQLVGCGVEAVNESVTDTQKIQIHGALLSRQGQGIPRAEISILESGEAITTTDNGDFILEVTSLGTEMSFIVRGEDFSAQSNVLNVPTDGSQLDVALTLSDDHSDVIAAWKSGVAGPTATPGPSAGPTPTQSGAFSANGDTTSFGIPGAVVGNRNRGKSKYFQQCGSCHASLVGTHENFSQLKRIIAGPPMNIHMHDASLADIVAYLRYSGGAR